MNKVFTMALCALLAGCASEPDMLKTAEAERFRCDNDIAFTVRFADDSAAVNSNRGHEVLYRTAGGQSPRQTVYSNPRMRAEFGLGSTGREAILRYLLRPVVVRCVRE
jgi:hypothetical protein